MEVWGTGFNGVPSYDGIQHVELNATEAATMFQDFSAAANAPLAIGFAHRGRAGTDSMEVLVGPVGGPYTSLGVYGDGTGAWGYYTASYTTQLAGTYRLLFKPVYWSGNNIAVGNLLDAVSLSSPVNVIATANKTLVCAGDAVTLTAAGATSFSWTGGPAAATYTINLFADGVYTVTGASGGACTGNATVQVRVYAPAMSISASSQGVCAGGSVTLTANTFGGNTYKWNGAAGQHTLAVSPAVTTTYTATAFSASNTASCPVSAAITITSYPLPKVTLTASKKFICNGTPPAILTAGGAQTYEWSTGATSATILSQPVSAVYVVTGTGENGCKASASVTVEVSECTGLSHGMAGQVRVYPNPSDGDVVITTDEETTVLLISGPGQIIRTATLNAENRYRMEFTSLATGIYFLKTENGRVQKIIITK